MPERQEHQPGTDAPVKGLYEELNVFGSPTGKVEHVASDCRTRHGASVGERSRSRAARGRRRGLPAAAPMTGEFRSTNRSLIATKTAICSGPSQAPVPIEVS